MNAVKRKRGEIHNGAFLKQSGTSLFFHTRLEYVGVWAFSACQRWVMENALYDLACQIMEIARHEKTRKATIAYANVENPNMTHKKKYPRAKESRSKSHVERFREHKYIFFLNDTLDTFSRRTVLRFIERDISLVPFDIAECIIRSYRILSFRERLFLFQTRLYHRWGLRRRVRKVYSRIFDFCPWRNSSISN